MRFEKRGDPLLLVLVSFAAALLGMFAIVTKQKLLGSLSALTLSVCVVYAALHKYRTGTLTYTVGKRSRRTVVVRRNEQPVQFMLFIFIHLLVAAGLAGAGCYFLLFAL